MRGLIRTDAQYVVPAVWGWEEERSAGTERGQLPGAGRIADQRDAVSRFRSMIADWKLSE
jgi:hypothetical protein